MNQSVFYEMEFILLVVFSFVVPVGIYSFLYKKIAVSRWTVVGFALLLIVVAGVDVVLLQSLAAKAKLTESQFDKKIFLGQLSIALYLLPAAFAGLGINLLSHVLTNHLGEAEAAFDESARHASRGTARTRHLFLQRIADRDYPEPVVLIGSAVGTALIFILDIVAGADIRLHVLYIFPLAMVAMSCARWVTTIIALATVTTLQVITFSLDAIAVPAFITDVSVAFLASLMVIFLARSARYRYLEVANQAATDTLTNLANRRAFMTGVEAEIARQKRYAGIFSLAVLDLDGFKALNDSKGHAAGDEALVLVAEILKGCTRESDVVGRLGGDEFAILMPNTRNADCAFMFHELCTTIAARTAGSGLAVTASIGCRTFVEPPESASDAIRQADQVMFEAKRLGKNRALCS